MKNYCLLILLFFNKLLFSQNVDNWDVFIPSLMSECVLSDNKRFEDIVIDGNYLYAVGEFGVRKFDISDYSNIKCVKTNPIMTFHRKRSCVVYGNYLYFTVRSYDNNHEPIGGIRIFDKKSITPISVNSCISLSIRATDLQVFDHFWSMGQIAG